jgi:hypothetical protein
LDAPGLRLYERVTHIRDSIGRVQKKRVPPALKQLHQLLTKGLQATAALWPPLQRASSLVRQAAQVLANEPQHSGAQVRSRYLSFVKSLQEHQAELGPLGETMAHFCQITHNFAPGLFQCYDVEGLPCPNNELEQCFGVARVHERRATGRRGAIPGVVVRGSVRVVAAVTSKQQLFSAEELQSRDYLQWRKLRAQLQQREECRRWQFRFRKDPERYLPALEAQLLM